MIRTINPDYLTVEQQGVIADRVDPGRLIGLRPIRIVGPLVFYWTLHILGTRTVMTPRVRWMGRATKTLT